MSSTMSSKSPSSSSSWSSHPSPFPSSARKTMDEVWKDLSLFSFHHHSLSSINGATTTNTHLQDFLDPLTPTTAAASDPSPPPPILLTLNTRPNFHYLDDSHHMAARHSDLCNNAAATPTVGPYVIPPFNVLATASPLLPSSRKKRPRGSEDNPGDRRRKRLIKNRESAARSRARKQVSLFVLFLHLFFFFLILVLSMQKSCTLFRLTQTSWRWKLSS